MTQFDFRHDFALWLEGAEPVMIREALSVLHVELIRRRMPGAIAIYSAIESLERWFTLLAQAEQLRNSQP